MPEYLAPGVYVEEIDSGSKPIEGVSTSTAGMIGVTERGPVNVPILVTGTGEFARWFGERLRPEIYSNGAADPHWLLPHAIEGFFTNGGKRVYVTRVLDTALAARAAATLFDRGTAPLGSTVLLRAVREATGTAASPPLPVVLDGANLAANDWVRVGDGSDAEYRQLAGAPAAEDVLVPLNFPLSRSHAGTAPISVEQFTPAAPLSTYTLHDPVSRGDATVTLDGLPADIGALAAGELLEIGASANVAEHRFVRQVTPLAANRARVRLDSGVMMAYPGPPAAAPVRRITLGAGPPSANLAPPARAGESLLFVDTRGGDFDTRTDLVVVDRADADAREVRRIGELRAMTLAPAAADAYPASSLVEGVDLADHAPATVTAAAVANTLDVSDVGTISVGQALLVGPAGGPFETVAVQAIAPGAAPAGTVTLAAPLATPLGGGELVIPVRALTADAPAGASFLALDNRLGLSAGDVVRVGAAPDDEYAVVRDAPNRAPAGVRPDAGTVLLESPLALAHPAATPVVLQGPAAAGALQPTVLALDAAPGDERLLLSDGAGYAPPAPPAQSFVRITTATGVHFHRVAALTPAPGNPGAVAPQAIDLGAPLGVAHPVGSPVIERGPLLDVEALDAGVWGNRLRVSVEDEDPGLAARTPLGPFGGVPTQIRLSSTAGVEPGTVLEMLDPATGAPVGNRLLKVGHVNRLTGDVTLDGPGLNAVQQAAAGGAPPPVVRSREFRLTVRLLRQPDPANPSRNDTVLPNVEIFRNLSMDPRHSRYVQSIVGAIGGPPRLSDRRPEGESWYVRVADRAPDAAAAQEIRLGPETLRDVLPDGRTRAARHRLGGGDDSIATLTDATYLGVDDPTPENRTGLQTLRNVEEISIVACPGRTGPQIQLALIGHCELMRYRFAVLDGPRPPQDTLADVRTLRQQYDTKYAALYHPWLLIPDPFPVSPLRIPDVAIAPSGHVVGVYARTDVERGVHKAPANEVVRGITGLQRVLNKEQQDILNPSPVNVNVLRDFRPYNRGIRVYGGRCITSDPDWKYVNVRRLLIFVEASIDRGLQWVVFEPNAEPLWARVRRSISNFLTLVWRNGGLEGTKVEEAYFVKCDRTTMTQTDIDNGRLICVVGVAPVKPAEFVIIRIGLWTAHAED